MENGSNCSSGGKTLFSRSISGIVCSTLIFTRCRTDDISLIFWICSAYFENFFCRSVRCKYNIWIAKSTWNKRTAPTGSQVYSGTRMRWKRSSLWVYWKHKRFSTKNIHTYFLRWMTRFQLCWYFCLLIYS